MMNKTLIEKLEKSNLKLNWNAIDSVEWKSQESTKKSILFYNLPTGSKTEWEKAKNRLKASRYALCIINTDEKLDLENTYLVDKDEFVELQELTLEAFYPMKKDLVFLGVTGTNGKTTTVDIIRQLCVHNDVDVMTIGTLGVYLNSKQVENFHLTSPSYIDLRKTIYKYAEKTQIIAMELSSHALIQNRTGRIQFDGIAWTNLTQDHLDYHKTMENYLSAKKMVFNKIKEDRKVLIPTSQGELVKKIGRPLDIFPCEPKEVLSNAFFKIKYNRDNLSLALSLLEPHVKIQERTLNLLVAPDGRLNIIPYKDNFIIIDFAHTPDALQSICRELKNDFSEYNLITLFGCGGDRDRLKRPLMATAATENSDFVILTSDNSRYEDPTQIINDAKVRLNKNSVIEVDRKKAISSAIKMLSKSILLIAGKGHETYLDINGVKHPYSDMDFVMELIND